MSDDTFNHWKEQREKSESTLHYVDWYGTDYTHHHLGVRTKKQLRQEIESRILLEGYKLEEMTPTMWYIRDQKGVIVRTYRFRAHDITDG